MSGKGAPVTGRSTRRARRRRDRGHVARRRSPTGSSPVPSGPSGGFGALAPIVRVPGSFELPVVAKAALDAGADAVVALGVIIRGGTPHFEFVSSAATDGLTRVALDTGKPVGFGVLTLDDEAAGPRPRRTPGLEEDKGFEAADAAIRTALVLRDFAPELGRPSESEIPQVGPGGGPIPVRSCGLDRPGRPHLRASTASYLQQIWHGNPSPPRRPGSTSSASPSSSAPGPSKRSTAAPDHPRLMNWGLAIAGLAGLILAAPWGIEYELNYVKIGVKLVILVIIGARSASGPAASARTARCPAASSGRSAC